MTGITSTSALWYLSRATGVVALVLLTVVLLIGLLVTRQGRLPGLPRFAVTDLHRNLSLLSAAFVAVHVLTAVTDGYVDIPLISAFAPLTSPYGRVWLSLGAVAFDLMLASVITSLLRRHLSRRVWRAVHLTAYACWPIAWFHSMFSSGDLLHGFLLVLAVGCALAVIAGAIWRIGSAARDVPRAERVALQMSAVHHQAPGASRDDARTGRSATTP
ncbi:MAG TPA: ferric reductase-like transmembrane domain-containing protein [Trebonia sp.]